MWPLVGQKWQAAGTHLRVISIANNRHKLKYFKILLIEQHIRLITGNCASSPARVLWVDRPCVSSRGHRRRSHSNSLKGNFIPALTQLLLWPTRMYKDFWAPLKFSNSDGRIINISLLHGYQKKGSLILHGNCQFTPQNFFLPYSHFIFVCRQEFILREAPWLLMVVTH